MKTTVSSGRSHIRCSGSGFGGEVGTSMLSNDCRGPDVEGDSTMAFDPMGMRTSDGFGKRKAPANRLLDLLRS